MTGAPFEGAAGGGAVAAGVSGDVAEGAAANAMDGVAAPVVLRVVHGSPSPEEVAALVAVVVARTGSSDPPAPARSLWSTPYVRGGHHPAPGAWRASALPR